MATAKSNYVSVATRANASIPGIDYPTDVQSDWSDYWLEPKQQHRFLCSFPVYMPAEGSGVYDTRALKKILNPKGTVTAGSSGATQQNIRDRFRNAAKRRRKKSLGEKPSDASKKEKSPSSNTSGRKRLRVRSEKTRKALVAKYLKVRPQTYIVASFTPPSYGSNVPDGMISGGKETFAQIRDATAKLNDATITLVSTVRDDLHFSMNLVFQLAQKNNLSDGGLAVPLFPEAIWGEVLPKASRILTILDMGARPDPYTGIPALSPPEFMDAVPIGIHKILQPYVTNIAFGEYSYEGSSFLMTTLTLRPAGSAFSGYSYEAYVSQKSKRLTRDDKDTDPANYTVGVPGPGVNARNLAWNLADTYARYPNFFVKSGTLGVDAEGEQKPFANESKAKLRRSISDRTAKRLGARDKKVDKVMGKADGTAPDKRPGMLEPLLKTKAQQIAEEAAAKAAEEEAAAKAAADAAAEQARAESPEVQEFNEDFQNTQDIQNMSDEDRANAQQLAASGQDPADILAMTPEERDMAALDLDVAGEHARAESPEVQEFNEDFETTQQIQNMSDEDRAVAERLAASGQDPADILAMTPEERELAQFAPSGEPYEPGLTPEQQQQIVGPSSPMQEISDRYDIDDEFADYATMDGPTSESSADPQDLDMLSGDDWDNDEIVPGPGGMTQDQVDEAYGRTDALLEQQPGQGSGGSLADQATQESLGGQLGGDDQYQSGNGASNTNSDPAGSTPGEPDPPGMGSNPNCIGNSCVPPSHTDPETGERVINEGGLRWSNSRGYYDPNA